MHSFFVHTNHCLVRMVQAFNFNKILFLRTNHINKLLPGSCCLPLQFVISQVSGGKDNLEIGFKVKVVKIEGVEMNGDKCKRQTNFVAKNIMNESLTLSF